MMDNIDAEIIEIGKNTIIHESAVIRGVKGKAQRIIIGDNVYIGANVQIICDDFRLGDYSKIHHGTNVHGYMPCQIGHNAWIGQYSIIDSIGGTTIGDNCGIGAHSQLWSHIKYGDTLEGSRFKSESPLRIGKDVWFVGHCIVSPITAHDKSMALVGSVVTRDMEPNRMYAGSPAKDITEKAGAPFQYIDIEQKYKRMMELLNESGVSKDMIKIVTSRSEIQDDGRSYFCIETREYTKTLNPEEIKFMNFLLPDKAKFTPIAK